jgi:hypothetical protein
MINKSRFKNSLRLILLTILFAAATIGLAACTLPYALLLELAGAYHNTTSVGDLDGDGDLDVLLHNQRNEAEFTAFTVATFWLNQAEAGFTPQRSEDSARLPGWAAKVADIDDDGVIDLITFTGDRVHIALGDDATSSTAPAFGRSVVVNAPVRTAQFGDLVLGDLDGDGWLDGIVTGCCGRMFTLDPEDRTPNVSWMWFAAPDVQGVLTPRAAILPALDGVAISAAALGDLDGDSDLDLYVGVPGASNRILLNDGDGNFVDSGQQPGVGGSAAIALGDLDDDGDLDVLAGAEAGAAVWRNQGGVQGGARGVFVATNQTLPADAVRALFLADFDADGDLDALVGGRSAASLWRNNGVGDFTDSGQHFQYSERHGLAVADFTGDSLPDLFTAAYTAPYRLWRNQGDGMLR